MAPRFLKRVATRLTGLFGSEQAPPAETTSETPSGKPRHPRRTVQERNAAEPADRSHSTERSQTRTRRPRRRKKPSDQQQGTAPTQPSERQRSERSASQGESRPRRPRPERREERESEPIVITHEPPPSMEGWELPPVSAPAAEGEDAPILFRNLDLDKRILRAVLDDLGFQSCTPIQGKALPPALEGKDVSGKAQTGTGKTAAFLITILQRFLGETKETDDRAPNQPYALVLAPTRELAIQIDKDAAGLARYTGVRHVAVYGGMDYKRQQAQLAAGVDLVLATPGRLIDYCRQRVIDLSKVKVLVIDEGDRMLDMGFMPDLRRIVAHLPARENRQTLLFSATLPPEIVRMASQWMVNPEHIEVNPETIVAEGIEEVVYAAPARDKLAILLWVLANEPWERVLIFRNRRSDVERLYRHLMRYGVTCEILTGDVPQKKRLRVLEQFRAGELRVIVATDVAGRGIHVEDISHVVNFDLPYEPDDYVHRIGRTGRAGSTGRAISFACEEGSFVLPDIEEYIQRELTTHRPEPEMLVLPAPKHEKPVGDENRYSERRSSNRRSGGGGGGRGGRSGRRPPRSGGRPRR